MNVVLWFACATASLILLRASRLLSLFPLFIFTSLYAGGLDFESYLNMFRSLSKQQLIFVDINHIQYLFLFLSNFLFQDVALFLIKFLSLPIFFFSADLFLKRFEFSYGKRLIFHLFMFAYPFAYLSSLSVFRQSFSLAFALLFFAISRPLSRIFVFLMIPVSHVSGVLGLFLLKFSEYHGLIWLLFSIVFLNKYILSNTPFAAYAILEFSLSYYLPILLVSACFLAISLLAARKNFIDILNFLSIAILCGLVLLGIITPNGVTRIGFFLSVGWGLSIVRLYSNVSYAVNKFLVISIPLLLFLVSPFAILDRPVFQIVNPF